MTPERAKMSKPIFSCSDSHIAKLLNGETCVADVREVETVPVIRVVLLRGLGVEGNPVRLVTQYWLDGKKLVEQDPITEGTSK